jgi:thiol:disulfide interchange protein DsbC
MKSIHPSWPAALLSLTACIVNAETAQEALVKKRIQAHLGDQVKVESVTKTPYAELFEVVTDGDIVYTDAAAKYLVTGHITDTRTYRDYTEMRLEQISKASFSDLPLHLAMKQTKGNGKRIIAVFEDPNCGYCKQFRHTLQEVDNVTIYTFMYNMLSEDSVIKSKNIWCAAERGNAWDDWMLRGKIPPSAPASCVAPNEQVLKLGKKMRVTGTPTTIFNDGSRVAGALDKAVLEQKLAGIK